MRDEVEYVKNLFSQIPPDYGKINTLLQGVELSSEELAAIAVDVAEDCFGEYSDALDSTVADATPDTCTATIFCKACVCFLTMG